MRRFVVTLLAVGAALAFGAPAMAQQPAPAPAPPAAPAYGPFITLEQSKKVMAAAEAEAKKAPYLFTIAIVDPTGSLVYFEKMDGASYAATDLAIGKARTAAIFKRPSKAFFDQMESGHSYVSTLMPAPVAAAGGIPIMEGGKIIGAIGVSGGPSALIDSQQAQAGADAIK